MEEKLEEMEVEEMRGTQFLQDTEVMVDLGIFGNEEIKSYEKNDIGERELSPNYPLPESRGN